MRAACAPTGSPVSPGRTGRNSPARLRYVNVRPLYDQMMGGQAERHYEPGLDGVRALAVIAVLAFHDGRLGGGFLGVSTFFTLSGFLITGLILREHDTSGRISLRGFFGRRIRRLFPAAVAGVLLAAAVA